MTNIHKENLQKLREVYIETAERIDPKTSSSHQELWILDDSLGGKRGKITIMGHVRINYDYGNKYVKHGGYSPILDKSHPRYLELVKAFEEQTKKLDFPIRNHWFGRRNGTIYAVPIQDLPKELQKERMNFVERSMLLYDMSRKIREKLGDMQLKPEFFESNKKISELEEVLQLMKEGASITRPRKYKRDLRVYQNKLLEFLGIPTDLNINSRPMSVIRNKSGWWYGVKI